MNRLQRDVVILALLEQLKSRGSWSGETHLQEAAYFLQELLASPSALSSSCISMVLIHSI